jgi:hypothetical protein
LREERRLRVYENRVWRRIFGPKRDEVQGSGENYTMRSLMICTPHPVLCGDKIEKNGMGEACSMYGGRKRHVQSLMGKTEGKRPLGRLRHRWRV